MSIGCCRDRNIATDEPLGVTSEHKRPESVGLGRVEQRLGQSTEEAHEGAEQSQIPHPDICKPDDDY